MAILPVEIAGVNGVLRVHVVLGGAPLLLSKAFLKDLGCHIDLSRGHASCGDKRTVAAFAPPTDKFWLKGTQDPSCNPATYSSDECAIHRATCDSSRQGKLHSWIASASDRRSPETESTDTESQYSTDGQEQNPCDETRDYQENREGRWVRVQGIARRTLFDPMHDEQPFCQDLTDFRKTTVKFLGQQREMTIHDTWPQTGEMRSLWKGTTAFGTRDMPQDDTWKPNRHHWTRNAVDMPPSLVNPVAQAEHER